MFDTNQIRAAQVTHAYAFVQLLINACFQMCCPDSKSYLVGRVTFLRLHFKNHASTNFVSAKLLLIDI